MDSFRVWLAFTRWHMFTSKFVRSTLQFFGFLPRNRRVHTVPNQHLLKELRVHLNVLSRGLHSEHLTIVESSLPLISIHTLMHTTGPL